MDRSSARFEPVRVATTPEQRFEDYLQSRGMRNTEQRRELLRFVFNYHGHFDADQLLEQLPRKGSNGYVSRPTVYRTLNEFVDAGLLQKFELDGRSVFEHDYGYPPHDHFYCTSCQSLIEFQSSDLTAQIELISQQHQFQNRSHRLIISGVCEGCRRTRSRTRRRVDRI